MSASAPLILAASLILSPQHPAHFEKAGKEIWFSNPRLVDVQSLSNGIVISAREEGILHAVGLKSRELSIDPTRIVIVSDANFEALTRCPDLPVEFLTSTPSLKNLSQESLQKSERCRLNSLTVLPGQKKAVDQILDDKETQLRAKGLTYISSHWLEGKREISFASDASDLSPLIRQVLGPWYAFYKINFVSGPKPGRTLIFELTLFEVSETKARALGLNYPGKLELKIPWQGLSLPFSADLAENLGVGHVLARPQIRTKPGEKASFQSGGEIPTKDTSFASTNTTWKNYGLILTLEPDANLVTGSSEISLGFKVELSTPDRSNMVDGIPSMIVRRLESRFDLRVNENTILTTMKETEQGAHRSGLPGLLTVPLFHNLFSTDDDFQNDTELCFSLRPSWEEIEGPKDLKENPSQWGLGA